MSLHEQAVRALARALGMELIKSQTKNPFSRSFGKYCLWLADEVGGPLHSASLTEVESFLQGKVEDFLRTRANDR